MLEHPTILETQEGSSSMNYLYEELLAPVRLYIKRCSHCDLKYFGKTNSKEIEKYPGSGLRWTRHLNKHNAVSLHLWNSDWYYDTSIRRFALKFSAINKIVESNLWANQIPENGLDGGWQLINAEAKKNSTGVWADKFHSNLALKSSGNFRNNPELSIRANKNSHLPNAKLKRRETVNERKIGNEFRHWITNGVENKFVLRAEIIPENWYKGKVQGSVACPHCDLQMKKGVKSRRHIEKCSI